MESRGRADIRFQVDENPPRNVAIGLGVQLAILCIAGIVLTPVVVIRAAGGTEEYMTWAVFMVVLVCAITTVVQAVRVGRIGAGYVLLMGTSGAFIAVSITALVEGGPAMLAALIIVSSFFQFVLASRLALVRRILTQTVAGTVIMLIAVTVMPIAFDMYSSVPEGAPRTAAPVCVLITVGVMVMLALKATRGLRLWAPVLGVIAGAIAGAWFGIYDFERVANAGWIGIPTAGYPGVDLSFRPEFWALLPAFIFVTMVGAIETIGDSVAIQSVSWRRKRAVDFKAVQGAVAADGLGNLLSGLGGTLPNTTYSTSISVTELTGVGSRVVGVWIGVAFLITAFVPKLLALVMAVPDPVAGAYITVLIAMLFVAGMRIVVQDGISYRHGLIAGLAFWMGVGCQNNLIFPEIVGTFAGGVLQNGMTSGGLVAVGLTLFMEFTESRPRRVEAQLGVQAMPQLQEFVRDFALKRGWNAAMGTRMEAVVEETILTLVGEDAEAGRRLLLVVRKRAGDAVLEFIAGNEGENLQDQISLLGDKVTSSAAEAEVSLRLLRHLTSSVRHQRYYQTDIVTCTVRPPTKERQRSGARG